MLVLTLVVLAAVAIYYWMQNGSSAVFGGSSYQAVFLSNGQVYFGKVSSPNSNYVVLSDVYYLQVQRTLQPVQGSEPQQVETLSLAKLGVNELHRPKDEMRVNRQHVIFIEDLQDESQVVQAIEKYKSEQE